MKKSDAKKAMKKEFEKAFPGVTFKIRAHKGTAYVQYTDGPAYSKIFAKCGEFCEKGFESSKDLGYFTGVNSGFDYVYPEREISEKYANELENHILKYAEKDRFSVNLRYNGNNSEFLSEKDLENA